MKKELKKLKRSDLVELIYNLKKSEQLLQEENSLLKTQLNEKNLKFEELGSVADAAVYISKILEAAQDAADIYIEEAKRRKFITEQECEKMIEQAKEQAAKIVATAQKEADITNN